MTAPSYDRDANPQTDCNRIILPLLCTYAQQLLGQGCNCKLYSLRNLLYEVLSALISAIIMPRCHQMKCGIYGDITCLVSSGFCSNLFNSSCTSMHHAFNRSYGLPDFRTPISRSQKVQLSIAPLGQLPHS